MTERFLVGSYTNKSSLKKTNLPKKKFSAYQFRDGINEAMTIDEMTHRECVEQDEQRAWLYRQEKQHQHFEGAGEG